MAEKPLTKSDLIAALKEIGVVTKSDVREIIAQEVPGIVTRTVSPMLTQSERRMKRFIRAELKHLRTDMATLATSTPTRGEFKKLQEKIEDTRPTWVKAHSE